MEAVAVRVDLDFEELVDFLAVLRVPAGFDEPVERFAELEPDFEPVDPDREEVDDFDRDPAELVDLEADFDPPADFDPDFEAVDLPDLDDALPDLAVPDRELDLDEADFEPVDFEPDFEPEDFLFVGITFSSVISRRIILRLLLEQTTYRNFEVLFSSLADRSRFVSMRLNSPAVHIRAPRRSDSVEDRPPMRRGMIASTGSTN